MDLNRRKKRKINEISKSDISSSSLNQSKQSETAEFKEPVPKKTAAQIKECPFNPFGDDSCDMCGA